MSNDWPRMWESKPAPKQEETKIRILQENEINWQQVRIQAAIAAMQAYISSEEHMERLSKNLNYDDVEISKFLAKGAVMDADALVEELQKKNKK